jgi:hypothetical protein
MFFSPLGHRYRELLALGLAYNNIGFLCLGAPIAATSGAGADFAANTLNDVCMKARLRIAALAPLRVHPQFALPLLRSCIATGFTHLLRTFDYGPVLLQAAASFDAAILAGFFTILDVPPDRLTPTELHCATSQIRLPLSLSGLGLRSMVDVAACAYVTMFNTHMPLVTARLADFGTAVPPAFSTPYEAAIRRLRALGPKFDAATLRAAMGQRALSALVDEQSLATLLVYIRRLPKASVPERFCVTNCARLLSLAASAGKKGSATRGASQLSFGWLTVRPVLHGLHAFGAGSFRFCLFFRLGLPPCWAATIVNATICRGDQCSAHLDRCWHHYLACPSSSRARTILHDALNAFFARWCLRAKVSVTVDPHGTVSFSDRRPGDTILRGQLDWVGSGGTFDVALFLDFVVPHPCVATHTRGGASRFAGSAAFSAEKSKRAGFRLCMGGITEPASFRPIALETYGLLGASAANTFWGIARQIVARTPSTMALEDKAARSAAKGVLRSFYTDMSCVLNQNLYTLFRTRSTAADAGS